MNNTTILETTLSALIDLGHISRRSYNVLNQMGVQNVRDIVRMTARDIMRQRNCGETTIRDISEFLGARHLKLDMTEEEITLYEREDARKGRMERLEKEDFWVKQLCEATLRVAPHISGIVHVGRDSMEEYADESIRFAKILVERLRNEVDNI